MGMSPTRPSRIKPPPAAVPDMVLTFMCEFEVSPCDFLQPERALKQSENHIHVHEALSVRRAVCGEHVDEENTQERSQVGAPHHSQELQARGAAALSTTGRWRRMDNQDHDVRLVWRDGLLHIHFAQPQAAAVATQRKGEPKASQQPGAAMYAVSARPMPRASLILCPTGAKSPGPRYQAELRRMVSTRAWI